MDCCIGGWGATWGSDLAVYSFTNLAKIPYHRQVGSANRNIHLLDNVHSGNVKGTRNQCLDQHKPVTNQTTLGNANDRVLADIAAFDFLER